METPENYEAPPEFYNDDANAKKGFQPAIYAKIILGIAILLNVFATSIGSEWDARAMGALFGGLVMMPGFFLAVAYVFWWITGRRDVVGNIVLTILAAFYLLGSLGMVGQKVGTIVPTNGTDSNVSTPAPQQNPGRQRD